MKKTLLAGAAALLMAAPAWAEGDYDMNETMDYEAMTQQEVDAAADAYSDIEPKAGPAEGFAEETMHGGDMMDDAEAEPMGNMDEDMADEDAAY